MKKRGKFGIITGNTIRYHKDSKSTQKQNNTKLIFLITKIKYGKLHILTMKK